MYTEYQQDLDYALQQYPSSDLSAHDAYPLHTE